VKITAPFTLVLTLLLTSCGLLPLSAEEQAYKDNCQIVYDNYKDYMALQTDFNEGEYNDPKYEWKFWSGGYAITNAGNESRANTEASIKANFPWIYSLVEENFANMSRKEFLKQDPEDWAEGDLGYTAIEIFFNEMAKGSTFTLTKKILKLENPSWENFSDPGINDVFASFAPSDRFKDCDAALGLDEELAMATTWDDFGFVVGSGKIRLDSALDVSTAIWGCNKFGVGFVDYGRGWEKCAGSDFTFTASSPTTYEPTPEEIAILEERRQDAEREAQNPPSSSGNSNVKPLQGCSSLGSVVQTDDYGQLTCKLVLMNRIKALVWMRS
jgi:hypothetical protein